MNQKGRKRESKEKTINHHFQFTYLVAQNPTAYKYSINHGAKFFPNIPEYFTYNTIIFYNPIIILLTMFYNKLFCIRILTLTNWIIVIQISLLQADDSIENMFIYGGIFFIQVKMMTSRHKDIYLRCLKC